MKTLDLVRSPYISLAFNFAYALGNCIIGFLTHSWWFITVGAYYAVLTVTRYSVLQIRRKANGKYDTELFARRITGILLVVLSFCIVGVNIMSAVKDCHYRYGKDKAFCFSGVKDTPQYFFGRCVCFHLHNAKINAGVLSRYESGGNLITKHIYGNSSMDRCTTSRNQSDWRKIYGYG